MRQMTFTALLAAILLLSGSLKIPSPLPGGEFQLSAPLAVLICAFCGWRRYLLAGVLASLLGLLLGVQNALGISVQLAFRSVVAVIMSAGGSSLAAAIISGPIGTLFARLLLAQLAGIDWLLLAAAAVPGMLFTAICAGALYRPLQKLLARTGLAQRLC